MWNELHRLLTLKKAELPENYRLLWFCASLLIIGFFFLLTWAFR